MLFAWNDKKSWNALTSSVAGKRPRAHGIKTILLSEYKGALVYHGCRTTDVKNYYANGLQRSSCAILDAQARAIFLTSEFPEITSEKITAAISDLSRRDEGRIYACLDRRELLEMAGHYLIYGSERLCAIAASLSATSATGYDYRQILKRTGLPTMLHVALPWEYISEEDLDEFCALIAKNLSAIRSGCSLPFEMFTFEWWTDLPSSAILSHEHPNYIIDPLLGMNAYVCNEARA